MRSKSIVEVSGSGENGSAKLDQVEELEEEDRVDMEGKVEQKKMVKIIKVGGGDINRR